MDYIKGKKLVIIGTGSCAKGIIEVLQKEKMESGIVAVLDRDREKEGSIFLGFKVQWEGNLRKYAKENVVFIIASQYFDDIYRRLTPYGINKLNCMIPNLYCNNPPCEEDDEIIAFSNEKYLELYNILEDDYSRELLKRIKEYRGTEKDFMSYEDLQKWGGMEDYWLSVAPTRKNKSAIVIDGGAYIGDSIEPICTAIGEKVVNYYAFEPNEYSCQILSSLPDNCEWYNKLTIMKKGLRDKNEYLYFDVNGDSSSFEGRNSDEKGMEVEVINLDSVNFEQNVDVFIKMDIQGSEYKALEGGENLIKTRKPSLAICVYHKANDLVKIPLYLKKLVPEYKIYLRGGNHTICIAQV